MLARSIVSAVFALLVSSGVIAQDAVPRTSYIGAPDGLAAPMAGEWSAFRPGGEERTLITCSAPVTITPVAGHRLRYKLFSGAPIEFETSAQANRTRWRAQDNDDQTAIWVSETEFHLYPVTDSGEPDWAEVLVYFRCPENPRTGYEGAIDGDSEAFSGNWSLHARAPTGNQPTETIASCDEPNVIRAVEPDYVEHSAPDLEPANARLTVRDGYTVWTFEDGSQRWKTVWINPDVFYLYLNGIDRVTDWRLPFIFERCP